MKKILMTLTLALAAAIAIPTSANAQQTNETKTAECCAKKAECKKENCKKTDCKKENCAPDKCNKDNCKKEECKKDNCKDCKNACVAGKNHKYAKHAKNRKFDRKNSKQFGKKGMRDGNGPLFKGITLTQEQQAKVSALREKQRAEYKKNKAEAKVVRKEEAKKNASQFEKELEKILTPEQMTQLNANKEAMKKDKK